ncbi:hypothetical protein OF83DRAFT_1097276 [Amylostereum chailletii]|nr:hypothetical protein OF83DRAFT_1097276 [Amylostereum chailletii]
MSFTSNPDIYSPATMADDFSGVGPSRGQPPGEARRRRAARACIHCRKRHWKCKVSSGQGTRCDRCLRMNLHCEYLPTDATATSSVPGLHNSPSSPGPHGHHSSDDRLPRVHDPRGQEIPPPFYTEYEGAESPSPSPPFHLGTLPQRTLPPPTSIQGPGQDITPPSHIPPIHNPYRPHAYPPIYPLSEDPRTLSHPHSNWYPGPGPDGRYPTYPGESQGAPFPESQQGWPGVTYVSRLPSTFLTFRRAFADPKTLRTHLTRVIRVPSPPSPMATLTPRLRTPNTAVTSTVSKAIDSPEVDL